MTVRFEHVETRALSKVYGPTRALTSVDVRFDRGQVTSVEGPNGSGKSTLLSLLGMLARPSKGEIYFGDRAIGKSPSLRAAVGVLGHAPMVYPDLNAHENLRLFAQLYGLSNATERLQLLAERFHLGSWAERPARTYSRGQLQRVALARSILHAPQLLLLDEPSTGLDVASVERLVAAVQAERERGAIIVLVTHDDPLRDQLADRRIKLAHGRVVAEEAKP
ncbi:MAG TPA: ABC transporter ATP-binding protein [Polyangiales bacterium]|nr:ABC transporter ATP-binding protein [Polyangiales bacterium]